MRQVKEYITLSVALISTCPSIWSLVQAVFSAVEAAIDSLTPAVEVHTQKDWDPVTYWKSVSSV